MPLNAFPCEPWPIDPTCCDLPEEYDPAELERWAQVATNILWSLSGRRWGPSCPITIRPCGKSCEESFIPSGYAVPQSGGRIPYTVGGKWFNAVCGCKQSCSCTELCELRLDGPVYDVLEVVVDGVVLPPEAYRIDSANILVRLDGECWEACQDLNAPPTEPGTAAVTYRTGLPLDEAAIAAVSELTCHLMKGCGGAGSCGCRVPTNMTRMQRQGVTIERADPASLYSEGKTGLPMADAWLAAVNPYRMTSPSRAWSPDLKRPRYTTWP